MLAHSKVAATFEASAEPRRDDLSHYLTWGIIVSFLVHLVIGWIFAIKQPRVEPIPLFASIEIPESLNKARRQLVSQPEVRPDTNLPPKDTNLESERDTTVAKEQIHRGDPLSGPAEGKKESAPPAPQPKKQAQEQAKPQLPRKLNLDPETLRKEFAQPSQQKRDSTHLELTRPNDLSAYEPFSRPFGAGAAFLGLSGSNDYLPDLPDGDITLLNAKANRFAVFVRRVATRVFAEMRTSGWEVLRNPDINSARDFAVVKVTTSPKGEVLNVSLESNSGSSRFDQVLVNASRIGSRDPNPPSGALASDGNIHFIFQSRSWSEVFSEPRSGRIFERRWLLLGTGLE